MVQVSLVAALIFGAPALAFQERTPSRSSSALRSTVLAPEETASSDAAVPVPKGTLWSFTGRLRTDEANVRQEFGGDRLATFNLDPTEMSGITQPTGFWDPLGFSKVDDETLMWYKHSELKHGRVCMLAFTGWWLNELGVFFPGVDDGIAGSPLQAWEATSARNKGLILCFCAAVEWLDELRLGGGGHYLTGGNAGLQLLPLSPKADTPQQAKYLLRQKNSELNNGRLAMLGIASFFAAETIPGSVPFIPVVGSVALKAAAMPALVGAGAIAEAATAAL